MCVFVLPIKFYALQNMVSAMLIQISLADSVTVTQSDVADSVDPAVLNMSFIR